MLENTVRIIVVVEAFSLQKAIEMLEVVVGWQEVK